MTDTLLSVKGPARKKKRRSRWGDEEKKTTVPGIPPKIPANLSAKQQQQYLCKYDFVI